MRCLYTAIVLWAVLGVATAHAKLDYVDADGVTERGGSTNVARMLPRTGPDGRLHKSLLPPLGALSATPDPMRLYVSSGAQPGGNGSAVAPFATLQEAVEHVAAGGAVECSAGTYSATNVTLAAGTSLTLSGQGQGTVLSLDVRVPADAAGTELRIVSADVSLLSASGGGIAVTLLGSRVNRLSGNASRLEVTRADLGSLVKNPGRAYVDSYSGYDTVPKALALKGDPGYGSLVMSGPRPVVGSEGVAYLSDIEAATDAVYAAVDDLRNADEELALELVSVSNVTAGMVVRSLAALGSATNSMNDRIAGIDRYWTNELATLHARVDGTGADVPRLQNDLSSAEGRLETADAGIRTDFAKADSNLYETVTEDISAAKTEAKDYADTAAAAIAASTVSSHTPGIISDAVTAVKEDATISGAIDTVNSLYRQINDSSGLAAQVAEQRVRIKTVADKVNAILEELVKLKNGESWTPPGGIAADDW